MSEISEAPIVPIRISEHEWISKFKPIDNSIRPSEQMLFNAHNSLEWALVLDAYEKDPGTVWTLHDNGVISNGLHRVNRQGHFITKISCPVDEYYEISDDEDFDEPEIEQFLALSTGHLTQETCNRFLEDFGHAYQKGDYGWFVYSNIDAYSQCGVDIDALPEDLARCLRYAAEKDCIWIMFDQDVEPLASLPTHQW